MPPTHRPSAPIPAILSFLIKPWWLPIALFWVITLGLAYVAWRMRA